MREAWENALAPYAFVVLPKPVKTVVIEKGIRRDLSTPPEWWHTPEPPASPWLRLASHPAEVAG